MNLLPSIHIHKGNCVSTFKFLLGTVPLLLNDALSVFEYVNSSKTKELWAFRVSENEIIVYSPPLRYALQIVDEYSLTYKMCDPARVLNWLPPFVVGSFVSHSEKITVQVEIDSETTRQTNLNELMSNPSGYNLR